jgi:hypothetical protein
MSDTPGQPVRIVLADSMQGVRDAWRWLLAADRRLLVSAEAGSVAEAVAAPGDVVLSGLRFADGTAEDLLWRESRPVVVWSFLPPDERDGMRLDAAAAVLGAGELRGGLVRALCDAAARVS